MKRKYTITILSVLIIVVSAILLVNKSSYASEPTNYCLDIIDYVDFSSSREEIEGIELPETVAIEDIHSFKSLGRVFYPDAEEMNYEWKNPNISTGNIYATVIAAKGNDISPEIGYLLTQLNFSNNKKDNNYYQQLLLFWAIDRLKGFDDDRNYIWSSRNLILFKQKKMKI